MKFLLDESLPVSVARALADAGEAVSHLQLEGQRGASDRSVLELARLKNFVLVTANPRIRSRPAERAALLAAGVAVFVFAGRSRRTAFEWFTLVVRRWAELRRFAARRRAPYLVMIPDRGVLKRLR